MKHAHEKFNTVQDSSERIPEDEPVFLIRGQDEFAVKTIEFWLSLYHEWGQSDDKKREKVEALVLNHLERIKAWPKKKTPDHD